MVLSSRQAEGDAFRSRVLGHIRRLTIEDGSVVVTATPGN
jgi:hypothetical protein